MIFKYFQINEVKFLRSTIWAKGSLFPSSVCKHGRQLEVPEHEGGPGLGVGTGCRGPSAWRGWDLTVEQDAGGMEVGAAPLNGIKQDVGSVLTRAPWTPGQISRILRAGKGSVLVKDRADL